MHPGPELDALIHKHVMDGEGDPRPYSTDIAAAWAVLERCYEGGEILGIHRDLDGEYIVGISHWCGNSQREDGSWVKIWDDTKYEPSYKAPTAPHAICIAAVAFWLPDCGEDLEYEAPEMTRLREMVEGTPHEFPKRTRSAPACPVCGRPRE